MVDDCRRDGALSREDLKNLEFEQIFMIDNALEEVGEFGEIRLVVKKGCFRFLILLKSFDAVNITSDTMIKELKT